MDANFLTNAFVWLRDMGRPVIEMVGDKKFSPVTYKEIKPDAVQYPAQLQVYTLDALCNIIDQKVDDITPEQWLLHVVDEETVHLIAKDYDTDYGRRRTLAQASPPETEGFEFGHYYQPDEFVIKLHANFGHTEDQSYVLQIASNITAERLTTSQDDGISQTVGMKQGIGGHLQTSKVLKNRVKLRPFRTFVEVEQPESEFLFRAKQDRENTMPTLALFEADGGKWRLEAIENISAYLRNHATGVQVIS